MRLYLLSLIFLVPGALCGPTAKTVSTPFGAVLKSSTFCVPEGGRVKALADEVHVLGASGNLVHTAKKNTNYSTANLYHDKRSVNHLILGQYFYGSTIPMTRFMTTWRVPEIPQTDNGQTIYLSSRIESSTEELPKLRVIQLSLQYGVSAAGGGNYWSISNWLWVDGLLFYTAAIPAVPGRDYWVDIYPTPPVPGVSGYFYHSQFRNLPATTLQYESEIDVAQYVYQTLASYNVVDPPRDYPRGGALLREIDITWDHPNPRWAPVHWTVLDSDPTDAVQLLVFTDGAAGTGSLGFKFPLPIPIFP